MVLTVDYIKERHRYWRYRIFDEGIWDVVKFEPVEFEVRPRSKTYCALFHRKIIHRKPFDRIIIYKNSPDMSVRHIDSLIVHEMIHQYIFQNNLHDTSTHGLLFKAFMNNINKAFPGELDIQICSESPVAKGTGDRTFPILAIKFPDRYLFCNIRPQGLVISLSLPKERAGNIFGANPTSCILMRLTVVPRGYRDIPSSPMKWRLLSQGIEYILPIKIIHDDF